VISRTFLLLFLVVGTIGSAPPTLSGTWSGALHRDGNTLAVVFRFDAAHSGDATFTAVDVGALDVPLKDVHLGRDVAFTLAGDTSTTKFAGHANGDTIAGTFEQSGTATGTFTLRRTSTSTEASYRKEAITFLDGPVRLAGTVFAPLQPGRHPAVALLQGSGDEGRWANAFLADDLARHGIVALAYDKRGVGDSGGSWKTATMEDLARDGKAAVHALALRADVDRRRIGIYGHSQGGQLAPAVAAGNSGVSWVIAADGPVGPSYHQDIFRVDTALAHSLSGTDLADAEQLYAEFVNVARTGVSHAHLRADMQAAAGTNWLDGLGIPPDDSWIWAWYRKTGNYDNRSAWAHVHMPVLLLFGADDKLVPVVPSIDAVKAILHAHGNNAVRVIIFPKTDHTLHIPPASPNGWPLLAPGFFRSVSSFARSPAAAR
jgi:alpha-beta hydrolase superfamily lysophospholipase